MIIAIDGPAGSGKSSTAKSVAKNLGIYHLDTGAMYRAITLKSLRNGIDYTDNESLSELVKNTVIRFTGVSPDVRVTMDGEDITDAIRSDEITKNVSDYCKPVVVREELVKQQRIIGKSTDVVCEGRDIGTIVFPDAELKIYMIATVEQRAKRRQKDFEKLGVYKDINELIKDIHDRDEKDSTRENSPLCKAVDAIELDTTLLTMEQQVAFIIDKAKEKIASAKNRY